MSIGIDWVGVVLAILAMVAVIVAVSATGRSLDRFLTARETGPTAAGVAINVRESETSTWLV